MIFFKTQSNMKDILMKKTGLRLKISTNKPTLLLSKVNALKKEQKDTKHVAWKEEYQDLTGELRCFRMMRSFN